MSSYVAYYEAIPLAEVATIPQEHATGLRMVLVGKPDEAEIGIYHVLDDADTAGLNLVFCDQCMLTAEAVKLAYPSMAGTTTIETEEGTVEVPRLMPHSWS